MSHRFLTIVSGLCFLSFFVSAQDAVLVVTASKEPTPVQTLPAAVTVLEGQALSSAATITDALAQTLDFRLVALAPGKAALAAPGFGENGFGRVALLLDGFSQANPDMNSAPLDMVPLFAVDHIEILNGPASALYGDGALAGAVQIITKTPQKWTATASTSLAQTLSNRQTLAFGTPVGQGGLLVSFQRDQNLGGRAASAWDSSNLWTKLNLPLSAAADSLQSQLNLWGAYRYNPSQLPGSLTQAEFRADPDQATNRSDTSLQMESRGGGEWTVESDLWKFTLPVSALYRQIKADTVSWSSYSDTALWNFDLEPRLNLNALNLLGGQLNLGFGAGVGLRRFSVERYPSAERSTLSVAALVQRFQGQGWVHFDQAWNATVFVSGSARVEGARTSAVSDQEAAIRGQKDFWPVSGQLGLTWRPSLASKLGLEVARVFRYPFIDEMISYYGYGSDGFYSDIEPEIGHSLTASAEWTPPFVRLKASGSWLLMENEIQYVITDPELFLGRNQNGAASQHVTAQASVELPLGNSLLGVDYALEKAWFVTGTASGKTVPLVPDQRLALRANWALLENLQLQGRWDWSAAFVEGSDFANSLPLVPARQELEASLTWSLAVDRSQQSHLELKLWAKNLTDDRTPTTTVYGNWYPSEGRRYGLTATYQY